MLGDNRQVAGPIFLVGSHSLNFKKNLGSRNFFPVCFLLLIFFSFCSTTFSIFHSPYLPQDLSIEKQWRASLQMEIQREKDRVVELTNDLKKARVIKKVSFSNFSGLINYG